MGLRRPEQVELTESRCAVAVEGLKTVALSNDHGPIDASKPFLAYGPAPLANSALVIGSKEVFQKAPASVTRQRDLHDRAGRRTATAPTVTADYLAEGAWKPLSASPASRSTRPHVRARRDRRSRRSTTPDLTPDAPYSTTTRAGFIRLKLSGGFGTDTYPVAWRAGSQRQHEDDAPTAPVLPTISSLTLDYIAAQHARPGRRRPKRGGRFFHVAPFGHAEQSLASGTDERAPAPPVPRRFRRRPRASSTSACADLHPPQNLALLFQVVDGTANPLVVKPDDHIHWTYLRGNEWVAVRRPTPSPTAPTGCSPRGSSRSPSPPTRPPSTRCFPPGMHWIRLAVASESDAVCRLVTVAAQALRATLRGAGQRVDLARPPSCPPGTITKLDQPDAAVKGIDQPFPTFGGRPVETTVAFATRVSERLRHKDRAIALWDYEHLILEAFPEIYQARCLNHTQYEPSATGTGIYRELAPGHVTVVTIPDLAVPNPRDPLRPFTSLRRARARSSGSCAERMSCFATLHVRNPQFEEVRVDLRVRFRDGVDETFHVNQLKREITELPLAVGVPQRRPPDVQRQGLQVGAGQLRRGAALRRLRERRPPVPPASRAPPADGPDLEEVAGSRAISILVSGAAPTSTASTRSIPTRSSSPSTARARRRST